jgi:dihydrolipoamide dehydrogenase
METFDAVVLGAGPGGSAAAQQIAHHGKRACLIEQRRIGGTCVNVGCMPTKAMLAATGLQRRVQTGASMGLEDRPDGVDSQAFMARVHRVVKELTDALEDGAPKMEGIDYRKGHGRLVEPGVVEIQPADGPAQRVAGENVVLATGSRPVIPDFLPADHPGIWTSRDAIEADELPSTVAILGGGALGCEFATVYGELGLDVTLVEIHDRLLSRLDPRAGQIAARSLARAGVEVRTGRQVRQVHGEQGGLCLITDDGREIRREVVLVAAGRKAVLDDCGLDVVGPETNDGILKVDSFCRTSVPGLYAVGDVAHVNKHAHLAMHMGMIAGDHICGKNPRSRIDIFPVVAYTHPQIACVGLCGEDVDRDQEDTVALEVDSSGTALVYGHEEVYLKVVARKDTGRICGALWAAPHASDLIHEIVLAMRCQATLEDLYATVHGHPSLMEMLHTAAENFVLAREE